ncbi:hypothetical protein [Pectobacterium phage Wc4-1]|uniref:Uncharacterized protein n=1 Tax=Pectobacterium phage Wc4 TaxID=2652428 RepID=A0A5P8D487_9CAUD|nr:hypothetical protein [Pectobacterium phage Wc4]QFP93948.1 hypothetical protein [Pectobacterium phage Wc4-1]
MKRLTLICALLFSTSVMAQPSETCLRAIQTAAETAAYVDMAAANINPQDVSQAEFEQHTREVDYPVVLELYSIGVNLSQRGVERSVVKEQVVIASRKITSADDDIPKKLKTMLAETSEKVVMCGYDEVTFNL